MVSIAILMTCHNRKYTTLSCLEALNNTLSEEYELKVFLVDDGSTDGTADAVCQHYSNVTVIKGDGNLFWNKGMHLAFSRALEIEFDAYLWLNDDTILYPNSISNLLKSWFETRNKTGADAIIVGSTQDPKTMQLTYGGVVRHSKLKRFRYTLIQPCDKPTECHTMNGNCVLIPKSVALSLGNLEPRFTHAMGDTDYGLRAEVAGIKVFVAAGYVGQCERNQVPNRLTHQSLSVKQRWKNIMQPKGLPPASWWVFTKRHGGVLAPVYWAWPYLRILWV